MSVKGDGGRGGAAGGRIHLEEAAVIAATLAMSLPFLGKAVHIDGWLFLRAAQRLRVHPWAGLGGTIGWYGRPFRLVDQAHPPFLFFYLAAVNLLTGSWSPAVLHAACLPFLALAAWSALRLARRFTGSPLEAALLAVATPAFVVNSHNIMSDVPAAAFMLAALASYTEEAGGSAAAAAGWTALALATAYQALFLLPLLAAYTFIRRLPWRRFALTAAPGLLVLAAALAYAAANGGGLHLLTALDWAGMNRPFHPEQTLDNLIGAFCVLGGATLFPAFLLAAGLRAPRQRLVLAAAAAAALLVLAGRFHPSSAASRVLFLIFFTAGASATADAAGRLARNLAGGAAGGRWVERLRSAGDEGFLLAWFLGYLAAALLLLPAPNARYYLPAIAPLAFLYRRDLEGRRRGALEARLCLILTAVLALLVAAGDAVVADAPRELARQLHPAPGGPRVWAMGDLGFHYYSEEEGAGYLYSDGKGAEEGDEVAVWNAGNYGGILSAALENRLEPLGRREIGSAWPLRTLSEPGGADFYSGPRSFGYLPFAWDNGPVSVMSLYRYRRLAAYGPGGPEGAARGKAPALRPASARWLTEVSAGGRLTIDLAWTAPAPIPSGLRTGVRLKGAYASQAFEHPLAGEPYPPEAWKEGEGVSEHYEFPRLDPKIFPGRYEIAAASWSEGTSPAWRPLGELTVLPSPRSVGARAVRWSWAPPAVEGKRWAFALARGPRVTLELDRPERARSLRVVSYLAYAAGIPQGEAVASAALAGDGPSATVALRAGLETADNAAVRERAAAWMRHAPALPCECWTIRRDGRDERGCKYAADLPLPPGARPRTISVSFLADEGILVVDELSLEE